MLSLSKLFEGNHIPHIFGASKIKSVNVNVHCNA